jgi:predicted enzyme related to lactoylglutathione lyase
VFFFLSVATLGFSVAVWKSHAAMFDTSHSGTIHFIDHYVVCTNDIARWESFHTLILGARTEPDRSGGQMRNIGLFQGWARGRHGGFIAKTPLPPTRGLGKGLPRYGFYIAAVDIDYHLRRLDEAGAIHGEPLRTAAEGDVGTVIHWQDPDGNQFEFWAPDVLPDGAMDDCGDARVGRISHGIFESRDLDRSKAFFRRYCSLEPVANSDIPHDTLVLRLAGGGRLIFRSVDTLEGRTTGCGLPDAHTALVVHRDDFFSNYARVWAELPEWEFDPRDGKPIEQPHSLPARTALHASPAGRKFRQITQRGDDWFDWDTNLFHFYGATPVDDSFKNYEAHPIDYYIYKLEKSQGSVH